MMKIAWIVCIAMCAFCAGAQAAEVTLKWDANNPSPTGYRLYQRVAGGAYNYKTPAWQGPETTCKVTVPDGVESYFVVRAYANGPATGDTEESGDSNEVVALTKPAVPKNLLIQGIDQLIVGLQEIKAWAETNAQ